MRVHPLPDFAFGRVLRNICRLAPTVVAMAFAWAITSPLGSAAQQPTQSQTEMAARQLIVLLDPSDARNPRARQIVDAVTGRVPNVALVSRLGHPTDAGRILERITPSDVRAQLATTPLARRALLEEYVLLTYPTAASADSALRLLKQAPFTQDPRVLSVERNILFSLSAPSVPIDHYYAQAQDPTQPAEGNYQWGMQLLNMPAAWGRERGTAYVAAVDAGIDCGGSNPCTQSGLHPDLKQNTRLHFSKNFLLKVPCSECNEVDTDDHIDQCSGNPGTPCREGHGTHVAGIIAATPQYGSFTNLPNEQSNTGVAGACWTCSLSMLRLADLNNPTIGTAITYAVDHGAQAINMSFGDQGAGQERYSSCSTKKYSFVCQALGHAADHEVVAVGASGNGYENRIQYPALTSTVIAVGGVKLGGEFFDNGYGEGNTCSLGEVGDECGSNYGTQDDGGPQIVAPARDVVSTVYRSRDHDTYVHCGDTYGPVIATSIGYGDCTGTSMAAPHVTGLVGLVRSANPLLTRAQVKSILLTNTVDCSVTVTNPDGSKCGKGYPDAAKDVSAALGGESVINRLTPLFSFYSSTADDHVYTIVPQMALAALYLGRLIPQPPSGSIAYVPIGATVPGYTMFPNCFAPCPTPKAMVSVFTSHIDPITEIDPITGYARELVPLYRMSWKCSGTCSHVSHFYTTSSDGITWGQGNGYVVDGIEGYIYPSTKEQPPGTVKLCRKYAPSPRDDYILFAGTGTDGKTCGDNDGYTRDSGGNLINDYTQTTGADWIGWVYPLDRPRPICANMAPCPTTLPSAPTIGAATAGNGSITVNFSAPAYDGGSPLTGYSATCTSSNGGVSNSNTGGGSATSIQVGGLTNGKSYTCTVTASNSVGPGPASAASNAVTPFDITPILILLLLDE